MILKAGTYRFNDVLTPYSDEQGVVAQIPFTATIISDGVSVVGTGSQIGVSPDALVFVIDSSTPSIVENYPLVLAMYGFKDLYGFTGWNTQFAYDQTVNITKDTEVDNDFGNNFIANTNYNEVNKSSLVTIEYNGSTIAELNAGETATLSCNGFAMASDVVVKVNEVGNGVTPSGTLEITLNNIEAEFPLDCSQYAKVTVNTAEPLRITDPNVLDNITDTPHGASGSVFLYDGETTDTYEHGAFYYLEDTGK